MKKILIICTHFASVITYAQDIHFSQFERSPLLQNPSRCGQDERVLAGMNYKNQWGTVSDPYQTFDCFGTFRFMNKKESGYAGAGILFASDNSGTDIMNNMLNASLAYHLRISPDQYLGAGLMSGICFQSIDIGKFQWPEQYDGVGYNSSLATGENAPANFSFIDAGLGMSWRYNNRLSNPNTEHPKYFQFGVAAFHPHRPRYAFFTSDRLNIKYMVNGSGKFALNGNNMELLPAFQFSLQGTQTELVAGTGARMLLGNTSADDALAYGITLGAYYRTNDAVIFSCGVDHSGIMMTLSYDLNTSELSQVSRGKGGLEFSLQYRIPEGNGQK